MNKRKRFNITGLCVPEVHYTVDISEKIHQIIHDYIKAEAYFTINRARQYGKTTTLRFLQHALRQEYVVIRISFEGKEEYFSSFQTLAGGLSFSFFKALKDNYSDYAAIFDSPIDPIYPMQDLGERVSSLCSQSAYGIVLMIDEVDKAADNQTFLSFLGMLREMYLNRMDYHAPAFSSVILTGVHDIKNLKQKIRSENEHSYNSPWNIATDFNVDMSFSIKEIAGMLLEYKDDQHIEMDTPKIAKMIYDYTSGYPYLVSCICKIVDEQIVGRGAFPTLEDAWTENGIKEAVKELMKRTDTLFDDIKKKLLDYSELSGMLHAILFNGRAFPYNPDNEIIDIGIMFGFLKEENGQVHVANRIFETRMYNYFMSEELVRQAVSVPPVYSPNQFVHNDVLNMDLVMSKFVEYFTDIYRNSDSRFIEENGRRLFLLYLKPIINGVGNYYIEARTRDMTRTDVVVDYKGHQYVIEMKIYHGNEYNHRGEEQLAEYLESYHLDKGYLLSFNFNKKKQTGIKTIFCNGKELVEAIV